MFLGDHGYITVVKNLRPILKVFSCFCFSGWLGFGSKNKEEEKHRPKIEPATPLPMRYSNSAVLVSLMSCFLKRHTLSICIAMCLAKDVMLVFILLLVHLFQMWITRQEEARGQYLSLPKQ